MLPRPVKTKKDFVRRYQQGEFGNQSPTWHDVWHWTEDPKGHGTSGWDGPRKFHLRNRVAAGDTYYNLTVNELMQTIPRLTSKLSNYYISQMAPTEHTLIQGEVQRTVEGLYLRYTRVRKPMRDALAERQDHAWGLTAKTLLARYMDQLSFDWLGYLLDNYPDHVVEFSTYGVDFGTIPFMNTVFWEVRLY